MEQTLAAHQPTAGDKPRACPGQAIRSVSVLVHGGAASRAEIALLALQAAVTIGVTTSLLPNKGLPLPFISYGGSNLVACLFGVGILLNIYRQAKLEPGNKKRITMQTRMTPRI